MCIVVNDGVESNVWVYDVTTAINHVTAEHICWWTFGAPCVYFRQISLLFPLNGVQNHGMCSKMSLLLRDYKMFVKR